ncbi:MAG: molybdopterin-dependent oxidoreductase, partial [Sinobacteraceae bacterium]|nr:molybdopterin-dependent oxidoreductase [Nevskiaceae bacterium]
MTTDPTRRQFLQAGAASGAAFVLGISLRAVGTASASGAAGTYSPDAFIRVDQQGQVTLIMPQVEMGQGIYTALAMIVAEELDVDLQLVVLEHAPPNDSLYGNPLLGFQVTGGSTSVRAFWVPLRKAAAIARATLVRAAAALWQVDPGAIRTRQGEALHEPSGRRIGYG